MLSARFMVSYRSPETTHRSRSSQRFSGNPGDFRPRAFIDQILIDHPRVADGSDDGSLEICRKIARRDSICRNESHSRMPVGSCQGFEHIHTASCIGWEKFEQLSAERKREFDIARCHHSWGERQINFARSGNSVWIQTEGEVDDGICIFCTLDLVFLKKSPST